MKRIMAVYDVDPFYADRFAEFTNQKETIPFTAVAFTSMARLKEFAAKQRIEILLVGDEVEESELEGVAAGQIVRLSETGIAKNGAAAVYKYQATDSILREVMECYQVQERSMPFLTTGIKGRVIGVDSPVGRCGKTGFAMTLGQVLSKDEKVLFITLEICSGLEKLTSSAYGKTLTDLLYYFRQGNYSHLRLSSVIYNWGGLDYVPPVTCMEDLADIRGSELAKLLKQIADEGIYSTIVVDLGNFTNEMEEILNLCSIVYVPYLEDVVSTAKLEEWKEHLEKSDCQELWERIRLLKLPRPALTVHRENYLEQELWGEMGDFVRGLIGKQKEGMRS